MVHALIINDYRMIEKNKKNGRLESLPPWISGSYSPNRLFFPSKTRQADETQAEEDHRHGLGGHEYIILSVIIEVGSVMW
jgi:hypothetical protein